MILAKAGIGMRFNEHMKGDGETIFAHACKMGLEGIVSKRKDSPYRSGRSPEWLKMKHPAAPAVKAGGRGRWGSLGGAGRPDDHGGRTCPLRQLRGNSVKPRIHQR